MADNQLPVSVIKVLQDLIYKRRSKYKTVKTPKNILLTYRRFRKFVRVSTFYSSVAQHVV